uniref:2-amino-3-carboxymuconate-6-semialdehyde decarboxylase n=1 Tax=Heterorhabditis bacteriophora TaxID=37862 RepID=A0A1I7X7E6_HETBA
MYLFDFFCDRKKIYIQKKRSEICLIFRRSDGAWVWALRDLRLARTWERKVSITKTSGRCTRFLKECENLGAVLFIHPWDMHNWDGRLSKFWMPWLVGMPSETAQAICCILMGNVLLQFPRLRFCFAHGGGSYPIIRGRVAHGYSVGMRPDLCANECGKNPRDLDYQLWTDSLVHDPFALQLLLSVVGKEHVVFGTDYPFPLGEVEVGRMTTALRIQKDAAVGVTRNLSEVFMLLRSNAQQNKFVFTNTGVHNNKDRILVDLLFFYLIPVQNILEEKMSLVNLEDGDFMDESVIQQTWIHTFDEVEFEFGRIRSRLDELAKVQRKHISRPNFGDETFDAEEKGMEIMTEQITSMMAHCQRLIK